jgi:adenosine deaminase
MSSTNEEKIKASLGAYIRALPKAEIHLHLEGSIHPERFLSLSRKYQTEYQNLSPKELEETLFKYDNFWDFLGTFKVVSQHLREPQDYIDLVNDLHKYLVRQNIRYSEVFFAPSVPAKLGFDVGDIIAAILSQGREVEKQGEVQLRWIFDCVRQFGIESAQQTAQLAVENAEEGVVALGLGGDEMVSPTQEFEEIFSWARAHQLHIHVHAGEIGGPSSVWDAVQVLGADRIGHGIQAARDPKLIEYLKNHTIALDVCLTSNAKTKAWTPVAQNPFGLLFKRGVPVTLSTDDPGLFSTDLEEEYRIACRYFDLSKSDLAYISMQGVRSSFLPYQDRMTLMQDFQDTIHQINQSCNSEAD